MFSEQMTKSKVLSKVMFSSLVGGLALSLSGCGLEEDKEPITIEGEFEFELPSSTFVYPTVNDKYEMMQDIKAEGERLQREREEAARKAEEERLAKIEAERKAEEERVRQEQLRIKREEEAKIKAQQVAQQAAKQQSNSAQSGWMEFNASYYTAYCAEGCTGKTATGVSVANTIYYQGMRIIAADTNVIPMWSIVEISSSKGSFQGIVLDRGGAIKGKKIDVLVGSNSEAISLGRHSVNLRVVRYGK